MLEFQFSWRTSLLLLLTICTSVSPNHLPDTSRRRDPQPFNHGPYALRLVSSHPNLTNTFLTTQYKEFIQNPPPQNIQPVWAGPSYWAGFYPNSTGSLFDPPGGAIFLDERQDNNKSLQLTLMFPKGADQHVPYLYWNWEAGPGTTHLWPATYYVSWGGFRFVRQTGKDEGRVFLFDGSGTNPRWRWAAEYGALRDSWYMREWNSTDPSVALPQNWEFVNVEVIPFEEVGK